MTHLMFAIAVASVSIQGLQEAAAPRMDQDKSPKAAEQRYSSAKELARSGEKEKAIEALEKALKAGADATAVLSDAAFLVLHESPSFRNLIRRFAKSHQTKLVTPGEPGEPMRVTGRIVDGKGNAVAGARIYVFQTGLNGSYSKAGGNVADSGDSLNPRIFGFMTSDAGGNYAFSTIRPGQYPGDGPPAHIHYEVRLAGYEEANTELMFEDDSRMSEETTAWAKRQGFGVCRPQRDAGGVQQCSFDITLVKKTKE